MRAVHGEAFSIGQVISRHPANTDYVIVFDGYTTIVAIASAEVRVGYWYNTYYDKGQFWIGSEIPVRND